MPLPLDSGCGQQVNLPQRRKVGFDVCHIRNLEIWLRDKPGALMRACLTLARGYRQIVAES